MARNMKESRQFNISVEGINCEKMYFDHLAALINTSGQNKFNASMNCRKASPSSFAKRNAHKDTGCHRGKNLPYLHIQDIEDYYDDDERKKFYALLDEIRKTETDFGISYALGYTNYTFELWMLLHVADMKAPVIGRTAYLAPINRHFHRSYTSLDQFKSESEFQGVLDEYVTLDSIRLAVKRAEAIIAQNKADKKKCENYKKFCFFRDNPDVSVHEIIKIIFDVCGVKL